MLGLLSLVPFHCAAARHPGLLDRLLAVEAVHSGLCQEATDSATIRAQLVEAVAILRGRLVLADSPADGSASRLPNLHGKDAVASLNEAVFNHLGIRPSQDLHDPCNLFLSRVLARKQGYCVGIAAVYLVLADQLELPVHAVATPSHVFLRYEDRTHRTNIETFQQGANVPDERYITEQKIAPRSLRKGIFLRGLTDDRFMAQVHNNLGAIYSEREEFNRAAVEYKGALRLDPRLPAAWYNRGKDLQLRGDYRRAIRYFSKALRLHPNDAWALNNRGLAYRQLGKLEKARRDFEEALRIDPGFEQARRNFGGLHPPQ